MSMERVTLEARVNEAMANDGIVDSIEIRGIVVEALNDNAIDPAELVVAKNVLEHARREVGDLTYDLNRAEGRVASLRGTDRQASAIARRDEIRSDLTRARNRFDAYARIEEIFRREADPASRTVGGIGNIFGNIFRGGRDILEGR